MKTVKHLGVSDDISNTLEEPQRFNPQSASTTFRIAISDFGSQIILPPLFSHIHKYAPNIQCIVSHLSTELYVTQLLMGEIDVAIISQSTDHPNISEEIVLTETVAYIVREGHPRSDELSNIDTFVSMDHILVNLKGEPVSGLDALLAKQGLSRNVKLVVPYFNAFPKIVSQTDLIGGLPNRLAQQAKTEYPIQTCAQPFQLPKIRFRMCWNTRRKHDLELQWFRSTLKKVFDSI